MELELAGTLGNSGTQTCAFFDKFKVSVLSCNAQILSSFVQLDSQRHNLHKLLTVKEALPLKLDIAS